MLLKYKLPGRRWGRPDGGACNRGFAGAQVIFSKTKKVWLHCNNAV